MCNQRRARHTLKPSFTFTVYVVNVAGEYYLQFYALLECAVHSAHATRKCKINRNKYWLWFVCDFRRIQNGTRRSNEIVYNDMAEML